MDNGSTEWADRILEVTLAMNTQKHSTIGCAPAELSFRERTSYIDWLNSYARKDLSIGVAQEDPTLTPIYALSPSPPATASGSRIDIGIHSNSQITMRINPEAGGSEIRLRITPPVQSSPIDEWFDIDAYEPGIQPTSQLTDEPELEPEPESEPESEPEPDIQLGDPVIEKAQKATKKARAKMVQKYSKKHDIQPFDIGDRVSVKVPREDRTSTDNRRLFGRILEELYSHRCKVLTSSGIIMRLMPTKVLGVVAKDLWSDIVIPDTTKEVTLSRAAREASTSARVGISCQCKGPCSTKRCKCYKESKQCRVHCHRDEHDCGNLSGLAIRTEIALVDRPRRKRARADTLGNSI